MLSKQNQTVNDIAREIAWTASNAILDGANDELMSITLSQLLAIRDIIEEETKAILNDLNETQEWKTTKKES
jgi:hypothetical protein